MMTMHLAAAMVMLLAPGIAAAQAPHPAGATGTAQAQPVTKAPKGEVTLVGCLERESAFRDAAHLGKGGPLHTGVGQSDEFVLSDARPLPAGKSAVGTSGGGGRAFMLTGKIEKDMADAINRQVEVVGTLHEASGKKEGEMATFAVTVWHPVADFCPAK
jgi:hypothetical protein